MLIGFAKTLVSRILTVRLCAVLAIGALTCMASANGAMGLALEMFDYRTWTVYVVVTIVLEAWIIGVKAGFGWCLCRLKSAPVAG